MNFFFRPFGIFFLIKLRKILLFHFIFRNRSFKIHLKSQYISISNCFPNRISMKQWSKDILRSQSLCCFIKHWSTCISYPCCMFKRLLNVFKRFSTRRTMRFINNKYNILFWCLKGFPLN